VLLAAALLQAAPQCKPGQTAKLTVNRQQVELVCSPAGAWTIAAPPAAPGGAVAGTKASMAATSGVETWKEVAADARFRNVYEIVARDRFGNVKWTERIHNIVVTEGLNDVLTKYFKGSGYTAAWYVGLKGTGTIIAGDTAASHSGWSEVIAYSEGARPTLTLGSASAGAISNTASKAVFTISSNGTDVYGIFITSVATKGSTTGVLFGGADFGTARTGLQSGDTLTITVTLTQSTALVSLPLLMYEIPKRAA
jgi:hypothetical protein